MKANVGDTDRIIRVVAGIAIMSALFLIEGNARWLGLIGIMPVATGLIHWCPAYSVLGMNTCGTGSKAT